MTMLKFLLLSSSLTSYHYYEAQPGRLWQVSLISVTIRKLLISYVRGLVRHLYDTVEIHIRGLTSLGLSQESYKVQLSPVVMKKLPHELRIVISHKITDDQWNLDCIMSR